MAPAAPKLPSYADIEALPPHVNGEIVAGVLYATPRPAAVHLLTQSRAQSDIDQRFGRSGGGWWILHEPELHLGDDVLIPDIGGWRVETMPEFPNTAAISVVPDWACEVLSPSTWKLDRGPKLDAYRRHGVGHVWMVHPIGQTVEVLRNAPDGWYLDGTFIGECTATIPPFFEAEFDIGQWWAPGTGDPAE